MTLTRNWRQEDIASAVIIDDLVILVKSKRAGQRVMASVGYYLRMKLKLKVNREKSCVVKVDQLEFLGFTFRGIRIWWTDAAFRDFKHRLRGLTARSWGCRWHTEWIDSTDILEVG